MLLFFLFQLLVCGLVYVLMCPIVRVFSFLCVACLFIIDKGGWSALCHSLFQCLWIGGCVGPRAGLGAMEKTRVLHIPGIEPWQSSL
jgi:hypothetical protein